MVKPKRIQRKRTKGWKMPEGVVYVGRPSKWANPFKVEDYATPETAVAVYSEWLSGEYRNLLIKPPTLKEIRENLRGKDLACWCREGAPCHADVLLTIANREEE